MTTETKKEERVEMAQEKLKRDLWTDNYCGLFIREGIATHNQSGLTIRIFRFMPYF
jgi:hypothetical protein